MSNISTAPSSEKLWLWADRVWERAKKHPVQGFRAVGPMPLEQVDPNRLITLRNVAQALAPNIPADHWRIRAAYLTLVHRHLGPIAATRQRHKWKMVGARYSKPERRKVHVTPREAEIRNKGWEISRLRAMEKVARHDSHPTPEPGHLTPPVLHGWPHPPE